MKLAFIHVSEAAQKQRIEAPTWVTTIHLRRRWIASLTQDEKDRLKIQNYTDAGRLGGHSYARKRKLKKEQLQQAPPVSQA